MGKSIFVQDSAQVFVENLETGKLMAVGCASVAGLNVETEQTEIRGGIGNKVCYTVKSSRNLTLNIETMVFQNDYLEMIIGGQHEDNVSTTVQSGGTVKVVDNAATLEVTLPADQSTVTTIILEDTKGVQETITGGVGGVFAVPTLNFDAVEGDELQYFYQKEITGTKFTIDAAKFASKCKVTYRTLSYDVDTETAFSDIWYEFPSVSSNGSLDLSLNAGEAMATTMTFTATAPRGETALGYKSEQLRK